ncbi:ABC transporter permease DevC [Spirulina subsalsa FACHB-351]|uniref:ABC transporter permease DevC n=1 Tax=Spirulina subsalsa FACHB-351 TaxID=234711 RepID=A0ABT3L6Q6_9CYAN|nr:ABC transporter permease DevC [Spirulina subsalsa]MCW6036759.1 ABC transporter permease DevC [Spirulina subsalsa FACHB-351]
MKIPLAWLQLTHEKIRLLVALAGISFANILMFMQFGFRDALFASAVVLHNQLEGDIFLMSPESNALIAMASFSKRRIYQALGVQGVASVHPLYLDFALWKNPETNATRSIMVIGINPNENILKIPAIEANLDQIKLSDVVLFDERSRPEFGPVVEWFNQGKTVTTEAVGRRLTVGGLFPLGASFGADGNIVTSDLNFIRMFGKTRDPSVIDVGVIKVHPGTDPQPIINVLREQLPNDVLVLSRQEFIDFEKSYWQESTAIGFIFSLGAGMGFIVGMVIVYQILYTDVSDHLPEYATLKAMGYKSSYLLKVVFQEAIILAVVGYIPGFLLSTTLYSVTADATSLPVQMDFQKASLVFNLTMVMCIGSGVIAVRRLDAADPADIF